MKDWLDKLREETTKQYAPPPKGFVCAKDAAKRWDVSVTQAKRTLDRIYASGKMQRIFVKRATASGAARVTYYGPK